MICARAVGIVLAVAVLKVKELFYRVCFSRRVRRGVALKNFEGTLGDRRAGRDSEQLDLDASRTRGRGQKDRTAGWPGGYRVLSLRIVAGAHLILPEPEIHRVDP
jgi:hypothetical protein